MTLENKTKENLLHEITALQKENYALKEYINKIYNIVPTMAISTVNDGRFISVNQAWLDTLDYNLDEVIGKTSDSLNIFVDFEERQKVAQAIVQNGLVRNQEIKIKTKHGKILIGLFCGDLVTCQDKNVFITTMVDITEVKIQQEKLICAQKEREEIETLKKAIEMKDEFISFITHEFKTPLTITNSAIQAMELFCRNELSDKARRFLNNIRQSSNRQLRLVNNLLDITRINANQLKVNKRNVDIVLLTRSITESINIFAQQKNIRLSYFSRLEKKVIGIDPEKYERILLNLLSNAIKFTPEGKSIDVKISQKIVKGKCKVNIHVIDRGIGIPDDKKDTIFEKFGQVDSLLTRQAEGTGIGLHLVKMLVEMMDGKISMESQKGMGTEFVVQFPVGKVKDSNNGSMIKEISDNRLIQAVAVEFSDIYIRTL